MFHSPKIIPHQWVIDEIIRCLQKAKELYGVPRKLLKFLPVQVWPGQRLATSPAPNPTSGEVTNQMKLGGGRYRAATKVKALSPEILIVSVVDTVIRVAGRTPLTALARLGEPDGV